MPIPTKEEVARWIVEFAVKERDVRPNEVAMIQWYVGELARKGWRSSDFNEALPLAIDRGWAKWEPPMFVRITQNGYDAATGVVKQPPAQGFQLGSTAQGFQMGHALVVGMAAYQEFKALPQSVVNDANDIAAVLTSKQYCGYPAENVELQIDSTLAGLRDGLKRLVSSTSAGDTVMIYFSGHGLHRGTTMDLKSNLLPIDCKRDDIDNTSMTQEEFSETLAAIPAERLVVFLDACHSGFAAILKDGEKNPGQEPTMSFPERSLNGLLRGSGRVVFASSQGHQKSKIDQGARNSVFTTHLLDALKGAAETTGGLVRIFELFSYVGQKVRESTNHEQHPVLSAAALDENFALALAPGGKS